MYSKSNGLIIGFHGCDLEVRDRIISTEGEVLKISNNEYDWLGKGIYFWQNDYDRAFSFAKYLSENPPHNKKQKIKTPAVLGAVIDLGYCFDLQSFDNLQQLKIAYDFFKNLHDGLGFELPKNIPLKENGDLLVRYLDCAIVETAIETNKDITSKEYDSVRGVFFEGDPLYENAGFKTKNHIQIALRNPNCIKGYFAPRKPDFDYTLV